MFGEGCEIPLEMFDVGIEGDGRIRDDFVLVQTGGTSLWHSSLGDSGSEHNFLSSDIGILAALEGGSEGSRGVHQVQIRVEM